jgi:hypothetical protein
MDADQKTNGKCANGVHANGHAQHVHAEEEPPPTPTQTRTRSLDSAKIATWEPDPEEKELIKLTWSDDFR